MSVRIYVEGGGHQGSTKTDCRQAFRLFLQKLVPQGSFRVVASGSRSEAFQDFCTALKVHRDDYVILLVDSEGSVMGAPWQHLKARVGDNWERPAGASDDQVHLMVESMENWLLADHPTIIAYYGQGFLAASLPARVDVEQIPKRDALVALEHASKPTTKGKYHKTRHGFDLLQRIDPARVRAASNHARRFFDVLARETR